MTPPPQPYSSSLHSFAKIRLVMIKYFVLEESVQPKFLCRTIGCRLTSRGKVCPRGKNSLTDSAFINYLYSF